MRLLYVIPANIDNKEIKISTFMLPKLKQLKDILSWWKIFRISNGLDIEIFPPKKY